MVKYKIVSDDSGDNYACPVDRVDEFYKIIESIESYWSSSDYKEECPNEPDFVIKIEGDFEFYLSDEKIS